MLLLLCGLGHSVWVTVCAPAVSRLCVLCVLCYFTLIVHPAARALRFSVSILLWFSFNPRMAVPCCVLTCHCYFTRTNILHVFAASVSSQVYSMTSDFMSSATSRYAADEFISFDESSDRPWGFKQVLMKFSKKKSDSTSHEFVAYVARSLCVVRHARQMRRKTSVTYLFVRWSVRVNPWSGTVGTAGKLFVPPPSCVRVRLHLSFMFVPRVGRLYRCGKVVS